MIGKFINIEDLLYTFKKKFWIIIVITLFTTIFGIYRVSKLQPTYVANATVFIGKGSELVEYYSKEEVDYYSQLVSIFNELSKVDGFFDNILKKNRNEILKKYIKRNYRCNETCKPEIFLGSFSLVIYCWDY